MKDSICSRMNQISFTKKGGVKLMTTMAAAAIAASAMGTVPVVLKEQLNQSYGRELISVPFSAKDKECAAAGVSLAGPKGNIPAQLSDVELWPGDGGFVKSALLWFVADDLAPLSSATYTPAVSKGKAAQPKSDLAVKAGKDSVEITTSLIGVRFPTGEKTFDEPAAAASVPGPLLGMRLGNGAWSGGSALTGSVAVSAWSGKLVASGPVFARAEIAYTLSDGNTILFMATVFEGDSAVRWKMSAPADSPGAGVSWSLPPGARRERGPAAPWLRAVGYQDRRPEGEASLRFNRHRLPDP